MLIGLFTIILPVTPLKNLNQNPFMILSYGYMVIPYFLRYLEQQYSSFQGKQLKPSPLCMLENTKITSGSVPWSMEHFYFIHTLTNIFPLKIICVSAYLYITLRLMCYNITCSQLLQYFTFTNGRGPVDSLVNCKTRQHQLTY